MRPNPLTRHQDARREIGHTVVAPSVARLFVAVFVLALSVPAFLQVFAGTSRLRLPSVPSAPTDMEAVATPVQRLLNANRRWLASAKAIDEAIGERSLAVELMRPVAQSSLTGLLGAATELALPGRSPGWLFYRPDLQYVTGKGFLAPSELRRRATLNDTSSAPPHPDPRPALLELRRSLAAQDIELIVMPVPVKPTVEFVHLAGPRVDSATTMENRSYDRFVEELREDGVLVFDVAAVMREVRGTQTGPLYLATDTHWRPETVVQVAERLGAFIAANVPLPVPEVAVGLRSSRVSVTNGGDTARLLGLGSGQELFPPETVEIRQVTDATGAPWQPASAARILLLGDSFTNVYSLATMGWGESAGLAEQLSLELGRPVDRISQNNAGAHATRELLSNDLRRGRDRLSGKRVVVLQFANRELAQGDWPIINLSRGSTLDPPTTFAVPQERVTINAAGVLHAIGPIPTPGSVPYNDHIVALQVTKLASEPNGSALSGTEALVYLWSMQDDELMPISAYQVGDAIALRLEAWTNVSREREAINRGEIDDPVVRLAEPWWGELQAAVP